MLTEFDEELGVSAKIGTVCHGAIEDAFNEALALGQDVRVDEAEATRYFRQAFIKHDLRDEAAYNDGLRMVRSYFERKPIVHRMLIPKSEGGGVERRFMLRAGEFWILGYIDLIERIEPGVYEVTDHKSGKWLFEDHDLRRDLQLGVYGWAVRELFPDAQEVRLKFNMLRHNCDQRTTRTAEECVDAVRYLVDRARQIEVRDDHPPVLGMLCSWCGVRQHCEAYAQAHQEDQIDTLIGLVATDDIDALGRARATAFAISKLGEKRYKALDKIIMAKLDAMGEEKVRTDNGWSFRAAQRSSKRYDLERIKQAIRDAGVEPEGIDVAAFVKIVKKDLDAYVDGLDLPAAKKKMLKATVGALGESIPGAKFIDARQAKK